MLSVIDLFLNYLKTKYIWAHLFLLLLLLSYYSRSIQLPRFAVLQTVKHFGL